MKIFIIILFFTGWTQLLTTSLYKKFRGSSCSFTEYLSLCTGLGGFATVGLFIWACFMTLWWIPLVTFFFKAIAYAVTPPSFRLEITAAVLFPVLFIASIVLLSMNI